MSDATMKPILWKNHEAVTQSTRGFNCYLNHQQSHANIIEMGTRDYPERFFLRARYNGELYASDGTLGRLSDLRDRVAEFAKALLAMLVILAPMLMRGGGL